MYLNNTFFIWIREGWGLLKEKWGRGRKEEVKVRNYLREKLLRNKDIFRAEIIIFILACFQQRKHSRNKEEERKEGERGREEFPVKTWKIKSESLSQKKERKWKEGEQGEKIIE